MYVDGCGVTYSYRIAPSAPCILYMVQYYTVSHPNKRYSSLIYKLVLHLEIGSCIEQGLVAAAAHLTASPLRRLTVILTVYFIFLNNIDRD